MLDAVLQVLGGQRGGEGADPAEELADAVRALLLDSLDCFGVLGAAARSAGQALPPDGGSGPRFRMRVTIEQLPDER